MTAVDQIREQQRQDWDKFSPGWKKWDRFLMDFFRPVGEKLVEVVDLRDGYRVLDASTGTGEPGLTAASKIPSGEVVGTDIAAEMVSIANENARERGIMNYRAVACESERQPFDENYFDAVICRFGIIYFPDMKEGTKELVRVLRPGGKLSLSAWSEPEKNPWVTTMGGIVNRTLGIPPPSPDVPHVFRGAKPGTLSGILKECGLNGVQEVEVNGTVSFASPEQYWDFMMDIAPPIVKNLSKADEATRQNVRKEVLEAAEKYKTDGGITFNWASWIGYGVK